MTRRWPTWLVVGGTLAGVVVGVVVGVVDVLAGDGVVVAAFAGVAAVAGVVVGVVVVGVVVGVVVVGVAAVARGLSVRVRRTRSSGSSGGLGGLHVSGGGNMRHLLHACTSVDRLVDHLLDRAVGKLPAAAGARFAEEWQDHRQHCSGWRLVWWALCVRATAPRTVAALGPVELPRDS